MKNRVAIDFLLIVVVYAACALLIYGAATMNWPGELGVQAGTDPETHKPMSAARFQDLYETWSAEVAGFSLFCALAWYALGEWGPRANKLSSGGWFFVWLAGLIGVIVVGLIAVLSGPEASDNGWILAASYMLWGVGSYYVATVFFSPVNTKFIPPGASLVRRGW